MKKLLLISLIVTLSSCLNNSGKNTTCTKGHYETYKVYYGKSQHDVTQYICDEYEEIQNTNNNENNSNSIPREISEEELKDCDGC